MDSSAKKRVGVNPRVGTPGAGAVNLENDFKEEKGRGANELDLEKLSQDFRSTELGEKAKGHLTAKRNQVFLATFLHGIIQGDPKKFPPPQEDSFDSEQARRFRHLVQIGMDNIIVAGQPYPCGYFCEKTSRERFMGGLICTSWIWL